ncbi:hypothetical protein EYF80_001195 [Liparis tanakae]|uniref:Uncharacterized protein n=1 Tax=Liparis tanakae TaxID=230148 RepID=A0A4Z2JF59_9TELE|nr:hypothetical protein EYF80_001195 [Liparis tanakae]
MYFLLLGHPLLEILEDLRNRILPGEKRNINYEREASHRHPLGYWMTSCDLYLGPCLSWHSSSTVGSITTLEDTHTSFG